MSALKIAMLSLDHVDDYILHSRINHKESGRHGSPRFAPSQPISDEEAQKWREDLVEIWGKPLHEPRWRRNWGLFDQDKIVGSVTLWAPRLESSLHRCGLGIGVQREYCGQGHGKRLMQTAIDWAKTRPSLNYIDLGVFTNNPHARNLYKKLGFREVGRIEDQFRVHGEKITDVLMVLEV